MLFEVFSLALRSAGGLRTGRCPLEVLPVKTHGRPRRALVVRRHQRRGRPPVRGVAHPPRPTRAKGTFDGRLRGVHDAAEGRCRGTTVIGGRGCPVSTRSDGLRRSHPVVACCCQREGGYICLCGGSYLERNHRPSTAARPAWDGRHAVFFSENTTPSLSRRPFRDM